MRARWGVHLGVLGLLALVMAFYQRVWTVEDTAAAMAQHSALAACIVQIETGHTLDPYSVGAQGELGVAQLHPQGLLPTYIRWSGGASAFDPYTSMDFLDYALDQGWGPQWTAWWYCT